MEEEPKSVGVEFFIDELARIEAYNDRRYQSMARRLDQLERKGKPTDDPTAMLGSVFIVIMLLQLAPVVIDLLRKWAHSESSQSSSLSV